MLHNIQQLRFKGLFFYAMFISATPGMASFNWHTIVSCARFFEARPAASGRSSIGDMLALL